MIFFDPSEDMNQSVFGFGPYTGVLDLTAPQPVNSGYGGIGFIIEDGALYGLSSYGSVNVGTVMPAITGGYGGTAYGLGPYGSIDTVSPRMSSAISLDGYRIEIFFSEEMLENAALLDPTSYTLTPTLGAPSTVISVVVSSRGSAGVLSVIITHLGTTLGGVYTITTVGLVDVSGLPMLPNFVSLFTLGDAPTVLVTPVAGDELLVEYSTEMLPTALIPPGGNSPSDTASYVFESSYPITLTPLAVDFPYSGNYTLALLTIQGMTSVTYTATVGPAEVISYDGSFLPSASTEWSASKIGAGTSRIYGGNLRLDKPLGSTCGWDWRDLTGRLTTGTTFRVDLEIDASVATFTPPGPTSAQVAVLGVQDNVAGGAMRATLTLQKDVLGSDQIRLRSGAYDTTFSVDWSSGPKTITLVRNLKAGFYTLLVDNTVITTTLLANFTGTSTGLPGASFVLLTGTWAVVDFEVRSLYVTASTTLFSYAWNFLHDGAATFMGLPTFARSTLLTRRGPLTKNWGDGTPATKADVAVRVAGTTVAVADVNPYIGQITLAIPIPLLPPGDPQADVRVDYCWMASPLMEFAALDTPGLVFDQYVVPATTAKSGFTPSAQPSQIGAAGTERFPFSLVLGPLERRFPRLTSHRYLGFLREYTAVLDSPTTLLFDQAPGRASVPGFEYGTPGVSVAYEGTTTPPADSNAWRLSGTDFGQVDTGAGTYTVIDAKTGSYDPADPSAVIYDRSYYTYPAQRNMVVRIQSAEGALFTGSTPTGADTALATLDGVFTGIGFGMHDGVDMALVGLLKINGVYHVGLLQVPEEPHLAASWDVGPKATGTASAQNTLTIPTASAPTGLVVGTRFQVLTGVQAGVYTVVTAVQQVTGVTTLTFTPNLPTAWDTVGAKYPVLAFEVRHGDHPFTYRITRTAAGVHTAEVSGEIGGTISAPTALPAPASASLLIPQDGEGHYFWGSLSRAAASKASWNFVRYGIVPPGSTCYAQDVVVNNSMSTLPEESGWAPVGNFGTSEVKLPSEVLLLRATSGDSTRPFTESYERTENFLSPTVIFDYRATFRLDDGVLGAGDLSMEVGDGYRLGRLTTLLYREAATGNNTTYRRLIQLPQVSWTGLLEPTAEGWAPTQAGSGTIQGSYYETTLTATTGVGYEKALDMTGLDGIDTYGRILQARLRVDSAASNPGIAVQGVFLDGTPNGKLVNIVLEAGQVALRDQMWGLVQAYAFDWADEAFHTYRLLYDVTGDTLVLSIDDQVQLPTLTVSGWPAGMGGTEQVSFGVIPMMGALSTVSWHSVSLQAMPPADAKRTLGIWKGGDEDDINSYEVPRTDNSTAPNSWQVGPTNPGMDPGPVVVEMDWRSDLWVRLYRDPEWGIALFWLDPVAPGHPPLPPPYFTGTDYLTESTEPSLAWINVEYSQLPEVTKPYGYASFGSLDSRSVCQQRWDRVEYRVFRSPSEERIAPNHMVLDQYNVINSGERTLDWTPEQVIVEALSLTQLSLLPAHIYASEVNLVTDGTNTYTFDQFTFDQATQTLTLLPDEETAQDREFVSAHAPVTVTFVPSKTVTNTYLAAQPVLDGVTLLNEGTPSYPKSQIGVSTLAERMGVPIAPYLLSYHQEQPGTLYDQLEFIEVSDEGETGLIKSICEGLLSPNTEVWETGTGAGDPIYSDTGTGAPLGGAGACANLKETGTYVGRPQGGHNLWFQGYWEKVGTPQDVLWPQQAGQNFLLASGGHFVGPVVDGLGYPTDIECLGGLANEAVVYPTWPALSPAVPNSGHVELEVEWAFDGLYTERLPVLTALGLTDSVPPTNPSAWTSNPDGIPGADGSALLLIQYTLLTPPVPGPWGGDPALAPVPDYGLLCPTAPVGGVTAVALFTQLGGLVAVFPAVVGPPVGPGDWSVTVGTPVLNLMNAINTHPAASLVVVAEAGIDLGVPMVTVKPLVPLALPDFYFLATSNPAEAHLGVALTVA